MVAAFLVIRGVLGLGGSTQGEDATPLPKATSVPTTQVAEVVPSSTSAPTQDLSTPEGLEGGTITINGVDGAEMVYIPEGEFSMGSDPSEGYDFCIDFPPASGVECKISWFERESPPHDVYLSAFWIHRTEVTIAQYWQCVNAGVCDPMDQRGRSTDHPVSNVTYDQARSYCQWTGLDLPTEAQWEKAARGTTIRPWPWGSDRPTVSLVNTMENEFDNTVPVAWCSFGRRTEFPRTERMKAYAREDIDQVWSINCFYIANGYRGIGLAERLIEKAIKGIKRRQGKLIEAYPVPLTKAGEKLPAAFVYTGPEIIFERQGFKLIQRLSHSRPLYRLSL